jgi:hypothetical protein
MKALILSLIFVLSAIVDANSQITESKRHVLLVSPIGLVAGNYSKVRVRYEYKTINKFAFGIDFKYYFPNEYPGYQLLPFVKMYLTSDYPSGFYFYVTGVYGQNKGLPPEKDKYFNCFGGGAGIGTQILLGRSKSTIIDLGLGIKTVQTNEWHDISSVPSVNKDFFWIGPGAIFDGIIGLGISLK